MPPILETFTPDNLLAGHFPIIAGTVTILTGNSLARGTVLGKITKAAGAVDDSGVVTGNGTVTAVTLGAKAKLGDYLVECIAAAANGGTFKVLDPDGQRLDDASVGTAYTSPQINFTVNDGSTDFAVGDAFVIPVVAGSLKAKIVNSAAVDGSQAPYGILAEAVDATSADKVGVAYLTGEFNEDALAFGGTDTADDHRAACRALSIFFQKPVGA